MADFIEKKEWRILILEDVPSDADLEEIELRDAGLAFTALRVDTRAAFEQALDEFKPDVVLADVHLPGYSGRDALEYTRRTHPQIPVILATGVLEDEAAVEMLKLGAKDYVLKDRLARLAPAIKRALHEEMGVRNRKLAEGKYKALFGAAMDGIALIEGETWRITDCNPEFQKQCSRTMEQIKELTLLDLLPPEQREPTRQTLLEIQQAKSGCGGAFTIRQPDGKLVLIEFSAIFMDFQQQCFIQCITRDITERVRADEALQASEEKYRTLVETTATGFLIVDSHGKVIDANDEYVRLTGYDTFAEIVGRSVVEWTAPHDLERNAAEVKLCAERGWVRNLEIDYINRRGEITPIDINATAIGSGADLRILTLCRDITERKQAEALLRLFRNLIDQARDFICIVDPVTSRFLDVNATTCRELGYTREELLQRGVVDIQTTIPDKAAWQAHLHELRTQNRILFEFEAMRKDGSRFPVEISIQHTTFENRDYIIGTVRNISERKQAERVLLRANRALKTLSAGNEALVRATDELELLGGVCRAIVEKGGYRMVWVGYADDNLERSITPKAWAGIKDADIFSLKLSWADTEQGQAPMSRAIRSGESQTTHDIQSDSGCKPWRELAIAQGLVSVSACPLRVGNRIIGSIGIYADEAEAFDVEERALLEELTNDLAFGIESLRVRIERDNMTNAHVRDAERLLQSLEQSIQAIADTVEARDPYTAGHQRRVSELATAIARELGLTEEVIHGIRLAATIHDLGKIQVPAEILVKPGKLSDIEFMLMKVHPQAGYDILKNVNFPWPIAAMVYQHHERLDGSGYPLGLKGEAILLESRILAVADVVEAMASYRPYRSALGIEAALAEIERGRGRAYDPAVVDACLKLFREGRFAFQG